jgi:hypothetical protein
MVLNLPAFTAFSRHHVLVARAHFCIVLIGGGQLAVIGRRHQVAVAVDQDLPAHLHGLRIHAAEQGAVLGMVLDGGIGQRGGELTTAEHPRGVVDLGVERVALVRKNAVEALHVGQLGDLVAYEIIQTNPGDARIDLVVAPGVAAVVIAVLVGGVHVVGIADGVFQAAVGVGPHDFLRLVGDAPADEGVRHKAGDAQDLAPRRNAQDAHVTRVAAAP